jgi:hypothetical protein
VLCHNFEDILLLMRKPDVDPTGVKLRRTLAFQESCNSLLVKVEAAPCVVVIEIKDKVAASGTHYSSCKLIVVLRVIKVSHSLAYHPLSCASVIF